MQSPPFFDGSYSEPVLFQLNQLESHASQIITVNSKGNLDLEDLLGYVDELDMGNSPKDGLAAMLGLYVIDKYFERLNQRERTVAAWVEEHPKGKPFFQHNGQVYATLNSGRYTQVYSETGGHVIGIHRMVEFKNELGSELVVISMLVGKNSTIKAKDHMRKRLNAANKIARARQLPISYVLASPSDVFTNTLASPRYGRFFGERFLRHPRNLLMPLSATSKGLKGLASQIDNIAGSSQRTYEDKWKPECFPFFKNGTAMASLIDQLYQRVEQENEALISVARREYTKLNPDDTFDKQLMELYRKPAKVRRRTYWGLKRLLYFARDLTPEDQSTFTRQVLESIPSVKPSSLRELQKNQYRTCIFPQAYLREVGDYFESEWRRVPEFRPPQSLRPLQSKLDEYLTQLRDFTGQQPKNFAIRMQTYPGSMRQ